MEKTMGALGRGIFLAGLGLTIGFLTPAAKAETLEPGHARGMCLDVGGREAVIARCTGDEAQDFRLPRRGSGAIRSEYGCLAGFDEGEALVSVRCRNGQEQTWSFNGRGQLSNGYGLCADVERAGRREGTRVLAFTCNGRPNQFWTATNAGGNDGYPGDNSYPGNNNYQTSLLSPQHAPGQCLDNDERQGTIMIFPCHGKRNQQFQFAYGDQTELRVNGNCVTAPRDGQQLRVARCNGRSDQQWSFGGDGSIRSSSGRCMDVYQGRRDNGVAVITFNCKNAANQRWRLVRR
jgi:hypothetical protein